MRDHLRQPLVAGVLGAALGMIAEGILNQLLGARVVTDGVLWGAVAAVAVASLPNFRQMGSRLLADGEPWQQLIVGLGAFVVISVIIVMAFFLVFSLMIRLVT